MAELETAVSAAKRLNEQIIKKDAVIVETKRKLEERDKQLKDTVLALGREKKLRCITIITLHCSVCASSISHAITNPLLPLLF